MKSARAKYLFIVFLLAALCLILAGCAETAEDPPPAEDEWPSSSHTEDSFTPSKVLMEMAFDTYGENDEIISYTITNTTMHPITFDGDFSLEFNRNGNWVIVPFAGEINETETNTLPGMQMCLIEVNLSLFVPNLPLGEYRIVRMIEDDLLKVEFEIAETSISVRDMSFGFEPLSSLSPDYDAIDAENDGCYVLMEDGPKNQDVVQRFADRVSLNVPAKLRTVMLAEDGGTLIRDIIFDPLSNGNGRHSVITDASRTTVNIDVSEDTYSFLSIAEIGNKNKVCLSNYLSYSLYAPIGAPLELISPNSPDNIDLVATVEMRTEAKLEALTNKFLIFGPDGLSFATISRSGNTFGYFIGGEEQVDIPVTENGVTLDSIKWMSDKQLLLIGTDSGGTNFQTTYDIEIIEEPETTNGSVDEKTEQ